MKYFLIIIAAVTSLIIASCGDYSTSSEIAKSQITDKLDFIKDSFNERDIDKIMSVYDPEFLNDGDTYNSEKFVWQSRLTIYTAMDYTGLSVNINNDKAVASFVVTFSNSDNSNTFSTPEELNDISYFHEILGDWTLIGNQQNDSGDNGYTLSVSTMPSHALVYVNGKSIYNTTPLSLVSLPPGEMNLKLYLYNYNEWDTTLVIPQTVSIVKTLKISRYPKPKFELSEPLNGHHYSSSNMAIVGVIKITDDAQNETDFVNGEYTINLNDDEETYATANGVINKLYPIRSGANILQLRATKENTGWSDRIIVYGDF